MRTCLEYSGSNKEAIVEDLKLCQRESNGGKGQEGNVDTGIR